MLGLVPALALAQEAMEPGPAPDFRYFQYERAVAPANNSASAAALCASLPGDVFEHAAPALKDLRVFREQVEVPYTITVSQPQESDTASAQVMNQVSRKGHVSFDLKMPLRPYSEVDLDIAGQDFVSEVQAWGQKEIGGSRIELGWSRIFDLSGEHLARNTMLNLPESSWPIVHVEMNVERAPGAKADPLISVHGAAVPPSRERQTVWSELQKTGTLVQRGNETVATFHVPAHVPVEWVGGQLDTHPGTQDFKREVRVRAWPDGTPESQAESMTGEISWVHLPPWPGRVMLHGSEAVLAMSFPAVLGANLQSGATVEVAIENGNQRPLPLKEIELRMRNRQVCFDGGPATMFYGDSELHAPAYRYTPTRTQIALLGEETSNPSFIARKDDRNYQQRHPEFVWVMVLAFVCVFGLFTIHNMRKYAPR